MNIKNTCSKCNGLLEEKRVGRYRYCLNCHAEYNRENGKRYSELTDEQKKRANARSYYKVYKKRGNVEHSGICEVCKSKEIVEAHHEDYNKPLEVLLLCKPCHVKYHSHKKTLQYD